MRLGKLRSIITSVGFILVIGCSNGTQRLLNNTPSTGAAIPQTLRSNTAIQLKFVQPDINSSVTRYKIHAPYDASTASYVSTPDYSDRYIRDITREKFSDDFQYLSSRETVVPNTLTDTIRYEDQKFTNRASQRPVALEDTIVPANHSVCNPIVSRIKDTDGEGSVASIDIDIAHATCTNINALRVSLPANRADETVKGYRVYFDPDENTHIASLLTEVSTSNFTITVRLWIEYLYMF